MTEHKPLILVADDESHVLHVVSLKLAQAGCDVLTAENGREALEAAQQHDINLLITDHQMPLLSGIELARRLAADDATSHIPVMLLTARGYTLRSKQLTGTRIAHVLTKPFSPTDLIDHVKRLIVEATNGANPQTVAAWPPEDSKPEAA